ncbi:MULTISPECIES: MFS transporter [Paenibacillus]|uniref:MFS transporter n=1 Tax=Paenibacillus TaxID=44249 RepID=UPI0003F6140A|nr:MULTISPECIES: MFS transporter [Paenibacillus]KGP77721.1 MFS transporter [Paenibacillus sp. MAEPY2]KGP77975.1 MFS transporter [Paenibacillus sp. MAEPY1]OZQ62840.1 MFS transporter [Paenibacillus taichungensis]SFT00177.1 Predicted arabinose efflux permease, MFS family [Paenibacillus sp. 453mf]
MVETAFEKNQTSLQVPPSIMEYVESSEKQRQLHSRTMKVVIASQICGGAGLAAGITVGALIAQDMLGTDSFAGVPTGLFTLGSAGAALMVGRLSQRLGRRTGLATGFLAGGIGAIGVVLAALFNSIPLLFISMLVYGAGTATNLQARYAGTDLALPAQRAKTISMAMVFTTFGAVAGPNLVNVTGKFATSLGAPALTGPFMLAAVAYTLAGLILLIFLRPDPFIVAKAIAEVELQGKTGEKNHVTEVKINKKGIIIGASVMVLTQIVMIAIMTMTPVHMQHHGHDLSKVGLVIGIHVASMYLPSVITGVLVDRFGYIRMAYASGFTLLLSGLLAAFAPGDSMALLTLALALLGLGWNFGLISGTAAIVDAAPSNVRAKTQGTVDVLIALSGASGGALSGMVVAHSSFTILSLIGAFLSLLLIPVVVWFRNK